MATGSFVTQNYSRSQTTRGLLATDHIILNHGQVTWTTPELAPPLLTTTPHQRKDISALDRFNVHSCPTRWVFSGTELEHVTRQGVPQDSVLSPVLFSFYITGIEKVLAKHCEVGIFADDIIVWSSCSDIGENDLKLNRAMEEAHSFAEMRKLIFNASKSLTTFFLNQ
ncbi:uncharacterized protein TNCV_3982881 [Trichonephila clavipes]|nr:uncharacterized protein TNCV_3982881 [Trichonephila clavipes]